MQPTSNFTDLVALMQFLRKHCAWDKAQTNATLMPYLLEETYELLAALEGGNPEEIQDELGDVLLQVVFHSVLYAEQGKFDMDAVIYQLMAKLIRRHKHLFVDNATLSASEVEAAWDAIKAQEKKTKPISRLKAKAGSALMQAQDVQAQAAKVGFDFVHIQDAMAKLHEEISELAVLIPDDKSVVDSEWQARLQEELGDCLFALTNVARQLGLNSELAAFGTVQKFQRRFAFIEKALHAKGIALEEATMAQMDSLWEAAKDELANEH